MTTALKITELDFDGILANLKDFLKSQDTFKDYDFDGAGLSILLKVLAYNTHYGAFNVNMLANEMFMASALLPRSVYSHAKTLNYLPGSRTGAKASVNITVTPPNNYSGSSFTLPRYQQFISEAVDGVNYSFVLTDDVISSRVTSFGNEPFQFNNVLLSQGEPLVLQYTVDILNNPKLRFEVPTSNADISTLTVQVQQSSSNTSVQTWQRSIDITNIDANSQVYFVERGSNGNYTVYFGDGIIGMQPNTGNIVVITFLVTQGAAANKTKSFTMLPLTNVSSAIVVTTSDAAGGAEEEKVENIKLSAPLFYSSQNRAVTVKDYGVLIPKQFPDVGSVSIWGGEENEPPVYGKVFISLVPKSGLVISQAEKDQIVEKLVSDYVMLGTSPVIIDPDYIYIRVKTVAQYDKNLTQRSKDAILTSIRNIIIDFNEANLRNFGAKFVYSKLVAAIDSADNSLVGNETQISLEKRFTPAIGKSGTYILNFNTSLKRGSVLEKLGSSSFQILDSNGVEQTAYFEEKPLAFTGIDDIVITNPGFGYLEPPLVTITGDGNGANAIAHIVNGKVESIEVLDKGENYTTAIVSLTTVNGGSSAAAKPVIAARFGQLRIYYYNDLKQKIIISENAGTIDYQIGQITVTAFKPTNYTNYISIYLEAEDPIIEAARGNILIIDNSDPASINIDLQESK